MMSDLMLVKFALNKQKRHPKCLGWVRNTPNGIDSDCDYGTKLMCDECKYGSGKKDPAAKCNQA